MLREAVGLLGPDDIPADRESRSDLVIALTDDAALQLAALNSQLRSMRDLIDRLESATEA